MRHSRPSSSVFSAVPALALLVGFCAPSLAVLAPREASAITYETLDYPGATDTHLISISGGKIFGYSNMPGSGALQYFTLNGGVFTPLNITYPGQGTPDYSASVEAMDGDTIVGRFTADAGRSYSAAVFVGGALSYTFRYPGGMSTEAHGVSDGKIVGAYASVAGASEHGFLYSGGTFTPIDFPGALLTCPMDISNGVVTGRYENDGGGGNHGFLWDGATYTALEDPPESRDTYVSRISGGNIIGNYNDSSWKLHGCFYDGSTWTVLNYPLASKTYASDVDGDTIIGHYCDTSNHWHGYIATIPEPSVPVLLALASLMTLGYHVSRCARSSWRRHA